MGKPSKKSTKPKSRSKMTRGNKKKPDLGKISKQEKKYHQKVKFNIPLKKNNSMYQKNQSKPKKFQPTSSMDMDIIEDDELILPLDMLSDEENELQNNHTDDEDDNNQDVESYERLPRSSFNNSNQQRSLLPIKTDRGQLIAQSTPIIEQEIPDDDDEEEEKSTEPSSPPVPSKPVSVVELIAERENKLNETKQTIVTLCDLIMKNPYEEISNLKQLRLLLNLGDPLISMTIRKLTMLSLVELFHDIVPGYRIRSLKEQTNDDNEEIKHPKNKKHTNKENLSKDVKIIRHFEQTLLKHYQFFLHFLEQCAKKNLPDNPLNKQKQIKTIESSKLNLGHLAIQCLCKLLTYLHNFNFRTNLLTVVVQFMASSDSSVQQQCCTCISDLLRNDHSSELSLEIVRLVTRLLKTRSYAVDSCVLDVFLSLNIREIQPIEEKKLEKSTRPDYRAQKLSRRDRRRHKEKQELTKVLETKTLANRQEQRSKLNRQIIELIFLNYFRLLKRRLNLRLMPSVCEGLAKFANLINIEYMDDLITCFYDELSSDQTGLNSRAKFHCLITVFSILNRQQVLIHIDPQRFYALFYSLLLPCPSDYDIDLVIKLIQLMLLDRYKQLSKNKLLAFIKRLLTMILHLQSTKSISAILVMIKALLTISSLVTEQLFDNEFSGSGIRYLPELNDPEYCHAQNATLYELTLLRTISNKNIREQCEEILTGKFQLDTHVLRSCQENALAYLELTDNHQ
jgi:nucleolar complex protein 3